MTVADGAILAVSAAAAGVVNAIAGGGTLITFPALLATGVPAVAGIPLGHIEDQWTIPLGAMAELDATGGTLHVRSPFSRSTIA